MAIQTRWEGPVLILTIDWPERRNALGPDEAEELLRALEQGAGDPRMAGVVLTGAGPFCSGGDLAAIRQLAGRGPEAVRSAVYSIFQRLIRTIIDLPVPTIAAVDGPAIGLGMDLALACGQMFVSPVGWLAQGWSAVGLIPGTGGLLLLQVRAPQLVWPMIGSTERLDAAACERWGLATAITEGTAVDAATARLRQLAETVPAATLAAYVDLERQPVRAQLGVHLDRCLEHQIALITAPEFVERTERFVRRS